jgi:hypothetical protein
MGALVRLGLAVQKGNAFESNLSVDNIM